VSGVALAIHFRDRGAAHTVNDTDADDDSRIDVLLTSTLSVAMITPL